MTLVAAVVGYKSNYRKKPRIHQMVNKNAKEIDSLKMLLKSNGVSMAALLPLDQEARLATEVASLNSFAISAVGATQTSAPQRIPYMVKPLDAENAYRGRMFSG